MYRKTVMLFGMALSLTACDVRRVVNHWEVSCGKKPALLIQADYIHLQEHHHQTVLGFFDSRDHMMASVPTTCQVHQLTT